MTTFVLYWLIGIIPFIILFIHFNRLCGDVTLGDFLYIILVSCMPLLREVTLIMNIIHVTKPEQVIFKRYERK